MNLLSHLFKRSDNSVKTSRALPINAGTHVTAKDLIGLQQQARKLNLCCQSYASASTTGAHRSRFRGRGMDYQESRVYQAGDDIRNMDWRVTARSGKPHTKLYQEERERPVVLLVDFSPSMFFGSTNSLKSVVAAKVAALIAWTVAAKGDRIGALLISDEHRELPPKMGKRGVLQLIRELVNYSDPVRGLKLQVNPNSFNQELQRLHHIARPGSLVFLISDFYNIDDETEHYLQRLSQHIDIQAIQIVDPLEMTPPPPARYTVTDGEDSGILNTRSKKQRKRYTGLFSEHQKKLVKMMAHHNIPLMQISTADDVLLTLQQNFSQTHQRSSVATRNKKRVA